MKRKSTLIKICKIGILAALAAVIQLFEIPLFFAPSFYELDLSDLVALVGGFAMGPAAGGAIQVLKNVLNLLLNGTDTAFVGEIANAVTGCLLVVPAAWIYFYRKTKKHAVIGLIVGSLSLMAAGALINAFVMLPFFSYFYHMPMSAIVAMGTAVNPAITNVTTLILFAVVPFNLLKGILCSVLTLLLYKRISPLLH